MKYFCSNQLEIFWILLAWSVRGIKILVQNHFDGIRWKERKKKRKEERKKERKKDKRENKEKKLNERKKRKEEKEKRKEGCLGRSECFFEMFSKTFCFNSGEEKRKKERKKKKDRKKERTKERIQRSDFIHARVSGKKSGFSIRVEFKTVLTMKERKKERKKESFFPNF